LSRDRSRKLGGRGGSDVIEAKLKRLVEFVVVVVDVDDVVVETECFGEVKASLL
jgi:hypothetical protein